MEEKSYLLSPTDEKGDDRNMAKDFVTVRGEKCYVKNGTLDLHAKEIHDITEIEGLEHLTDLKYLYLEDNQIKEIKGLEHLTNLQQLDLRKNQIKKIKGLDKLTNLRILILSYNQIEEIKGLERLTNLRYLYLSGNPIRDDERHLKEKSAQEVVRYCREKVEKVKQVKEYIVDKSKIYSRIPFEEVARKSGFSLKIIQEICEDMLLKKEWEGSIDPIDKFIIVKSVGSITEPEMAEIKVEEVEYLPKEMLCPFCQAELPEDAEDCPDCGATKLTCKVCLLPIVYGDDFVKCPHCKAFAHRDHMIEWIKVKGSCPNCKKKLSESDIPA